MTPLQCAILSGVFALPVIVLGVKWLHDNWSEVKVIAAPLVVWFLLCLSISTSITLLIAALKGGIH